MNPAFCIFAIPLLFFGLANLPPLTLTELAKARGGTNDADNTAKGIRYY